MNMFKKYSSNTLAGSGNQCFFINNTPDKTNIGRIYYKIFSGGKHMYSFLFSNITDSTFSDGSISHRNLIFDQWEITSLKVGICNECSEITVTEPGTFKTVTFNGDLQKKVMPGEFFYTDEVELEAAKNDYICMEIGFKGRVIPNHEESIIPTFVLENDKWIVSKSLPFPSMLGCDRKVCKKIAFLGDSITQGIGTDINSYKHWNAVLADMLGDKYAFWNLGLGFGRADDAASDGAWLYKAKQNDVVFVCFGVNDILQGFSAQQIKNNLKKIVCELKKCGIKVVIQTVPPFDYCGENIETWENINCFIKKELSQYADLIFDNTLILGCDEKPYAARFGGHPNAVGCEKWAKTLYKAIIENAEKIL